MKPKAQYLTALLAISISSLLLNSCGSLLGHIEANVPPKAHFDRILKRDLNLYFESKLKHPVQVSYELLRDGPTQTGISFPKYYAWVKVESKNKTIAEGAVRLAAHDQVQFEVTDFCSKEEIQQQPARISQIFPAALCPKIELRAKQ